MTPCPKHPGAYCLCQTADWKKGPLATDLWLPDEILEFAGQSFKMQYANEFFVAPPTEVLNEFLDAGFKVKHEYAVSKPPVEGMYDKLDTFTMGLLECLFGARRRMRRGGRYEAEDEVGVN